MMGDTVIYKPKCCACQQWAIGRICYAGSQTKIVDNPFCSIHYEEVYKQTQKLLLALYPGQIPSEWVYIQKWNVYQMMPNLPNNVGDLLKKGSRISDNVPNLQSLSNG